MKKYLVSCVDKLTGLELILSEAGYNEAMFYIDSHSTMLDVHCVKDSRQHDITIINTTTRRFLYDEARCVLLGD